MILIPLNITKNSLKNRLKQKTVLIFKFLNKIAEYENCVFFCVSNVLAYLISSDFFRITLHSNFFLDSMIFLLCNLNNSLLDILFLSN